MTGFQLQFLGVSIAAFAAVATPDSAIYSLAGIFGLAWFFLGLVVAIIGTVKAWNEGR